SSKRCATCGRPARWHGERPSGSLPNRWSAPTLPPLQRQRGSGEAQANVLPERLSRKRLDLTMLWPARGTPTAPCPFPADYARDKTTRKQPMFRMKAPASKSGFFKATIADADKEVADAIAKELGRQQHEIELIASENIVSMAVLEAGGTVLTNKYAEGYPGKRYYGGCQYVDVVEQLAIDRAKKLFGCGFANVQPHSGSQANQGVFNA